MIKIGSIICIVLFLFAEGIVSAEGNRKCPVRCSMIIDLFKGEPVGFKQFINDIKNVRVIYLGELHTIKRHHIIQKRVVEALCRNRKGVILALEQMESMSQDVLDQYNRGRIDFDEMSSKTKWASRWSNFRDYREIIESVHKHNGVIVAVNARDEIIKKIARTGLSGLSQKERKNLPRVIDTGNRKHERLITKILKVHAFLNPDRIRFFYEAQISRDEMMAERISHYLKRRETNGKIIMVLGGSHHFAFGLGVPDRVRRRIPGVTDRIILISESGDLSLSPMEKRLSRKIIITHDDLKLLNLPAADYLFVKERRKNKE